MGVSAGLYMYGVDHVVVKRFTFAISSADEFLSYSGAVRENTLTHIYKSTLWSSL